MKSEGKTGPHDAELSLGIKSGLSLGSNCAGIQTTRANVVAIIVKIASAPVSFMLAIVNYVNTILSCSRACAEEGNSTKRRDG